MQDVCILQAGFSVPEAVANSSVVLLEGPRDSYTLQPTMQAVLAMPHAAADFDICPTGGACWYRAALLAKMSRSYGLGSAQKICYKKHEDIHLAYSQNRECWSLSTADIVQCLKTFRDLAKGICMLQVATAVG